MEVVYCEGSSPFVAFEIIQNNVWLPINETEGNKIAREKKRLLVKFVKACRSSFGIWEPDQTATSCCS
jgi:hypothetical protein